MADGGREKSAPRQERLRPEVLKIVLGPSLFAKNIVYHESLDSTNSLAKELAALGKRVDTPWVSQAIAGLDELGGRLRRNVNRQLGLDALILSLSLEHSRGGRPPRS